MTANVRNRHQPQQVVASTTAPINTNSIGGFFCTAGGTVTINGYNDQGVSTVVVPTFTAVAGQWYVLPFFIGYNGGTIVTGAGTAGVLAT